MIPDFTVNADDILEKMRKTAAQYGLPFGDIQKIYNTRMAQEFGLWAEAEGKGEQFHEAVFKAYFVDIKDISDVSVLKGLASSLGLRVKEADKINAERFFKDDVDEDWAIARENEIQAIPTLMINHSRLVGAQPYEVIERFLEENGIRKR